MSGCIQHESGRVYGCKACDAREAFTNREHTVPDDTTFTAAIRETVACERMGVVRYLQQHGVSEAIWQAVAHGEHRGQPHGVPQVPFVFTEDEYRAVQRSRDEALAEVLRLKGVDVSDACPHSWIWRAGTQRGKCVDCFPINKDDPAAAPTEKAWSDEQIEKAALDTWERVAMVLHALPTGGDDALRASPPLGVAALPTYYAERPNMAESLARNRKSLADMGRKPDGSPK